jgi:7-keto-8-aminopelargonate synthetase-like enzyme
MRSVQILKSDKSLRRRLVANAKMVKEALCAAGKLSEMTPGPIAPIIPRSARDATNMTRELLQAGIYPPFVRYATGPVNGYYRFVISSEHSNKQLEKLVGVLTKAREEKDGGNRNKR